MKVYGVQHDIVWEDQSANCDRVRSLIAEECPAAGSLVVLPEMFATGFSMNVAATTTTADTSQALSALASEHDVYLMAGTVAEGDGEKARNEAIVYSPAGEPICRYVKQQPFMLGGEGEAYVAGDTHELFEWNGIKVAPFVCYDLRFPEIFRPAAAAGAEMMTVIASWPDKRIHHWVHLLRSRAIENQCYVIGVNRTGEDPSLQYNGHSIIVDYTGEVIADAHEDQGVISADLNFQAQREYRQGLPFLQDMKS